MGGGKEVSPHTPTLRPKATDSSAAALSHSGPSSWKWLTPGKMCVSVTALLL